MSGYIWDESGYVFSFAERTLSNLQLIEYLEKNDERFYAYETTQLINSAIGLLVFPKEKYYKGIYDDFSFPCDSDEAKIFKNINFNGKCHIDYYSDCRYQNQIRNYTDQIYHFKSPKQLARRLRNALCHDRLEIMPKQKPNSTGGKIEGFIFTDQGCVEEDDLRENPDLERMLRSKDMISNDQISCWQRLTLILSVEELRTLLIGLCKLILQNSKSTESLKSLDKDNLFWKEKNPYNE